jgi:hypothetical protein
MKGNQSLCECQGKSLYKDMTRLWFLWLVCTCTVNHNVENHNNVSCDVLSLRAHAQNFVVKRHTKEPLIYSISSVYFGGSYLWFSALYVDENSTVRFSETIPIDILLVKCQHYGDLRPLEVKWYHSSLDYTIFQNNVNNVLLRHTFCRT